MPNDTPQSEATRNRPAITPTRLRCGKCDAPFTGEDYHLFCGICIAVVAQSLAEAQGCG